MGVHRGRFTAKVEGTGVRCDKPWKSWQWWPVARAMTRMRRVLDEHPELGVPGRAEMSGAHDDPRAVLAQFEDLDRFARDQDLPHLAATSHVPVAAVGQSSAARLGVPTRRTPLSSPIDAMG